VASTVILYDRRRPVRKVKIIFVNTATQNVCMGASTHCYDILNSSLSSVIWPVSLWFDLKNLSGDTEHKTVMQFGPSFSGPAISGAALSCLAFSRPRTSMVRHFHAMRLCLSFSDRAFPVNSFAVLTMLRTSDVSWKFQLWKFHKFREIVEIFHGTILKVSLKDWTSLMFR